MNQIKSIFAALIICAAMFSPNVSAQTVKQTKPVVLILGSYHMGNPGRDLNNVKADDVRAEKRQKEIIELIAALKQFIPTQIAVEISDPQYPNRYAQYLDGKYELAANEVDQIGFRLAKELNHKQVYTVDWQGNFDFDKVLASAKTNNQMPVAETMTTFGKAVTNEMNEMMKTATVTELLRYLNDEKRVDEWHQPYLKIARVGAGTDFAGADLVADWYERNLKIYANITNLADTPSERVLVIIGAGHLKLLQQFVRDSGEFELEQVNNCLK